MNVANASFSQIPFHQRIVTRSPNHMCAFSWAMTSATRRRSSIVAVSGSSRSRVSRYTTRPVFSIAPWAKSGNATWSDFRSGYGRS